MLGSGVFGFLGFYEGKRLKIFYFTYFEIILRSVSDGEKLTRRKTPEPIVC